MGQSLRAAIKAALQNGKFNQLNHGVVIEFPELGQVTYRLTLIRKSPRGIGYRFPEETYRAEVTSSQGVIGYGFGEDSFKLLAIQKAISEALERAVYKTLKPVRGLITSNGWACHYDESSAKRAAASELLERHTVLSAWLEESPFLSIEKSLWPKEIQEFSEKELSQAKKFNQLHVLMAPNELSPTVTVAITNSHLNGFISHALHPSFDITIEKALTEVCRIASIYEDDIQNQSNVIHLPNVGSWDHAIAYAEERSLPRSLFGNTISKPELASRWSVSVKNFEKQIEHLSFKAVKAGAFTVVQAKSETVQDLYFGDGTSRINPRSGITPSQNRLKELHIVP